MFASTNKNIFHQAYQPSSPAIPLRPRDLQALIEIFDNVDIEELVRLEAIALRPSSNSVLEPWEEIGWVLMTETEYYNSR